MGKIIIPIEKRETEETAVEEKTLLDIAEEPAIKLAPAVPGAPNNMIQKHVDNFLAKIAGETPVDDEVRDSTEYWLNKIAESGGGASVGSYPRVKRLWRNTSPTSTFISQTVAIDLSAYNYVMVIAKYGTSGTSTIQPGVIVPIGDNNIGGGSINGVGASALAYRTFSFSATGIVFGDASLIPYNTLTPETNNQNIIPYAIYGIKI